MYEQLLTLLLHFMSDYSYGTFRQVEYYAEEGFTLSLQAPSVFHFSRSKPTKIHNTTSHFLS